MGVYLTPGYLLPSDTYPLDTYPPWVYLPPGRDLLSEIPTPCEQTDTRENSTSPQQLLRAAKYSFCNKKWFARQCEIYWLISFLVNIN